MAIDGTVRRSRRAVLGAALGGAAAAAASGLIAASPALADTGDNALLGQANTADAETSFENTTDAESSLVGAHAGSGKGIVGTSFGGPGVYGASTDPTPSDFSTDPSMRMGVYGAAGDTSGAPTVIDETGVFGHASFSVFSNGVWGDSPDGNAVLATGAWGLYALGTWTVTGDAEADGVGVYGWVGDAFAPPPPSGVAVYARAQTTAQTALQVSGKVKFSRAGRTYLTSSQKSKTIKMSGVTSSSYVIATVQTSVSGVYVRAVVPASGKLTIYLSKAGGKRIYVGYMVIN
jgi:hypothetical protein